MTCVRRVWLTLDGSSIELHDEAAGYFVTSFDLGSPDVREVTSNRPDADGIDDRTRYLGGRLISVDLSAISDAGAQIDAVAASFGPFMLPRLRPLLHYVLDRPGAPERVLTVRPHAYAFKVDDDHQRDVQLQFVAADPSAYDPTTQQVIAWSGASSTPGRTYPLHPPRTYPPGGGSPTTGILRSAGDVPVQPFVRIFGPITQPVVTFTLPDGRTFRIAFLASFTIGPGAWCDVDTRAKTAYYNSDPTQNMLARLDWSVTSWPVLPVHVDNRVTLTGAAPTTGVTQAVVTWQDGYLS